MPRATPRQDQAVALRNEGHTIKEISDLMDIEPGAVRTYLARAVTRGVEVCHPQRDVTVRLSPEMLRWLTSIKPEGASVATMICAILADAYDEENPLAPPQEGK